MNLNELLDSIKDLRIVIGVVLLFICIGGFCGYQLSPKPMPKSLMCKNELNQIEILNAQLTDLRNRRLADISEVQKKCIATQDELCATKIKKYREACLSLKCEVCRASR